MATFAAAISLGAASSASAITIDFETLADGSPFTPGNAGVDVSTTYSQLGVVFSSFREDGEATVAFVNQPNIPNFSAPSGANILQPRRA